MVEKLKLFFLLSLSTFLLNANFNLVFYYVCFLLYFLHFFVNLFIIEYVFYVMSFLMFKKVFFYLLFILVFINWGFLFANDYEFKSLDINADIMMDWTIDVVETFTTNFFKKKHGIIRTIPLNYTVDNTKFHINFDYVRVDWNKFFTYYDDKWLNIKIWDPNHKIKWEKIYPIFYTVYWLIRNFAWFWYTELYWNIVWYDFDTDIDKFYAELYLPQKYNWFISDDFLITVDWTTTSVRDFNWIIDWSSWDKIIISYNWKLQAWEWITLAIKFPKDYFNFDHDKQSSLLWYLDVSSWNLSNFNSKSSNFSVSDIDPDYLSSLVTFIVMIFGMLFLPSKTVVSSNLWSYNSRSWFSSWSSFSFWWFSRGWWWGWWGSRSW